MLRLPRLFEVLAVAMLCSPLASGCGDDDSDGGSDAGGGGSGGSGAAARDGGGTLPRPDAGPSEQGDEGWPCTPTEPCNGDLICAATPFTIGGMSVGVCAVACETNDDCNGGTCISYSDDDADAHCVDVIDEEYELCGVADTSICSSDLTCLYFPDYPIGVCVDLCQTGGTGDEDAGAAGADGMCSGAQMCIEGILADPEPGEGVCGTLVERDEECGLELGLYCADGDVCAPEDPNDDSSTQRCYEDCSDGEACEQGTCMVVQGLFAYCR